MTIQEKGNKAYKSKNFGKCINFYTLALKLDPYNTAVLCNRSAANF